MRNAGQDPAAERAAAAPSGDVDVLRQRLRDSEERIQELETLRDELTFLIASTTATPLGRLTKVLEAARQTPERRRSSLLHRDTRYQFGVAVAVMSAIPLLAFAYLLDSALREQMVSLRAVAIMVPFVVSLVGVGIVLLLRHTMEVTRLRQHLDALAQGREPEASLGDANEDFAAMERNLGAVIRQTDAKIRGMESRAERMVRAEQQRVMMETVGATCHHLGQPLTVVSAYLDLLSKQEMSKEVYRMIAECREAAAEAAAILRRLQAVTQYRTEPYLPARKSQDGKPGESILQI